VAASNIVIYSPALGENDVGRVWARAAHALFKIVNDQLAKSQYRFYAINGGNDLGGMFLTQAECEVARAVALAFSRTSISFRIGD
jgi:hypothetical protein